jgi:hypothetical protein
MDASPQVFGGLEREPPFTVVRFYVTEFNTVFDILLRREPAAGLDDRTPWRKLRVGNRRGSKTAPPEEDHPWLMN